MRISHVRQTPGSAAGPPYLFKVRLAGIDAPELRGAANEAEKQARESVVPSSQEHLRGALAGLDAHDAPSNATLQAGLRARDVLRERIDGRMVSLRQVRGRRKSICCRAATLFQIDGEGAAQVRLEKYGRVLAEVHHRGRDMSEWLIQQQVRAVAPYVFVGCDP